MNLKRKSAALAGVTAFTLLLSPLTGVASADEVTAQQPTFSSTFVEEGAEVTLSITLDGEAGAPEPTLTEQEQSQLDELLSEPAAESEPSPGSSTPQFESKAVQLAGKAKGPVTLRCDKNPRWSDARGTLSARFNCHHNTINWGYKISSKVKSIITGKVHERGVAWWKNGRRMPKNAGHVVGKSYHFHGTLKPVKHNNVVQFQDYMTFRVRVGGKTGTGSIAWASHVKAKK
ncbi:hypothetical protein CDO52_07070 [Nocardiopsis gilva YIM 90087]|uniref:Uncharacterized protein n=1 Tax=Nocardiopsis gilva YIM 90087 TaxID=1235441 RepID=A0A223S3C5_9ACTN|nr:hypothetical protein [Nocardiopsis gilva]ASU82577.1 hypothetical protein CDO52_07070 [Nocardiopsis gilva YIM 90087]